MLRRVLTAFTGCFVGFFLCTETFAQTQPFVPPTPGSKVQLSSGGWLEVDSVDNATVRTVNAAGAQGNWVAACYFLGKKTSVNRDAIAALWPLSTGKTISAEARSDEQRWSLDFKVAGIEKTTVAAGTFDTWIIEVDQTALTHAFKSVTRCWYAPDIGFFVKRNYEVKEGNGTSLKMEATRVEKRDRSKSAEFRSPAPGTTFYTNAFSFRIDGRSGTNLIQASAIRDKQTYWLGGLGHYLMQERDANSVQSDVDQLWPIEVGKTISFQANLPGFYPGSSQQTYHYRVAVERTETITVPAGTFSTFVIKWTQRGLGNNTFVGVQTLWWSPALGIPIKREVDIQQGITDWVSYELRSVQPPPS